MDLLDRLFLMAFESQRDAEFPSHEIDGPFCRMSRRVQQDQFAMIATALGLPKDTSTKGMAYIKEMSLRELQDRSRSLREATVGK